MSEQQKGTTLKTTSDHIDADEIRLDKCRFLLECIESSKVDPSRQIPGSDTIYQLSFNEAEILRLKGKLFDLIKEF